MVCRIELDRYAIRRVLLRLLKDDEKAVDCWIRRQNRINSGDCGVRCGLHLRHYTAPNTDLRRVRTGETTEARNSVNEIVILYLECLPQRLIRLRSSDRLTSGEQQKCNCSNSSSNSRHD